MRTRPKALLSVIIAFCVLFFALAWTLSEFLSKNYAEFEREAVKVDMLRLRDALGTWQGNLYTKLGDWSQWDDTYQFIQDQNPEYLDSNLQDSSFGLLQVNLIAISTTEGKTVFAKQVVNGAVQPFPQSLQTLLETHPYFTQSRPDEEHKGLIVLPEGPILFASRPVTTSDGTGEPNGRILFAYFLDPEEAATLSNLMHFPVHFQTLAATQDDQVLTSVVRVLDQTEAVVPTVPDHDTTIAGYTILPDVLTPGEGLLFRGTIERTIFAQGQNSITVFLRTMLVAALGIILVVAGLFEIIVLRKLSNLVRGVVALRGTDISKGFIDLPRGADEFRSLAEELNRSLASLYQTESRLEEQRNELKKFQLAAEKSFNHLVITDADGVVMYANPAASANTGYSNQEIIGERPSLWGGQMSKAFYKKLWRTIRDEKKTFFGEFKNRRKDGSFYLASASITPILDEQGEVRYFVGIERDITEERANQEKDRQNMLELEAANDRLAAEKARAEGILRYLRSIGEGVYATDKRGTIVFINETARKLLGLGDRDVLGEDSKTLFQFYTETEEDPHPLSPTALALEAKQAKMFPHGVFLRRPEQEPLPISGTFAPIIEREHIAGAIVVFQDITDRYQLEKLKENFLSIAAHQLRTPLGSMRWSMELLKNGDLGRVPKAAQETLDQLYENSTRMLTIVKDLLNVSKIDQGKTHEDPMSADIAVLVTEVVDTMKGSAKKHGITLILEKPKKKLPLLVVTRKHLFEALENLIANAIRYNRPKGSITISTTRVSDAVLITVADTGIGIPKADQNKIFAKFYRASNAVRHYTDGSGLGLAVVKSYVEENGGTVAFESEEGVGTTFTVRLPLPPTTNS